MSTRHPSTGCALCLPRWTRSDCSTRFEPCRSTLPDSRAASRCPCRRTATLIWSGFWPAWPRRGGRGRFAQRTSRSPGREPHAGGEHALTRSSMSGLRFSCGSRASQTGPPRTSVPMAGELRGEHVGRWADFVNAVLEVARTYPEFGLDEDPAELMDDVAHVLQHEQATGSAVLASASEAKYCSATAQFSLNCQPNSAMNRFGPSSRPNTCAKSRS